MLPLALGEVGRCEGGTPTLFINGRKIASLDPHLSDVYKSLVEFAAKSK